MNLIDPSLVYSVLCRLFFPLDLWLIFLICIIAPFILKIFTEFLIPRILVWYVHRFHLFHNLSLGQHFSINLVSDPWISLRIFNGIRFCDIVVEDTKFLITPCSKPCSSPVCNEKPKHKLSHLSEKDKSVVKRSGRSGFIYTELEKSLRPKKTHGYTGQFFLVIWIVVRSILRYLFLVSRTLGRLWKRIVVYIAKDFSSSFWRPGQIIVRSLLPLVSLRFASVTIEFKLPGKISSIVFVARCSGVNLWSVSSLYTHHIFFSLRHLTVSTAERSDLTYLPVSAWSMIDPYTGSSKGLHDSSSKITIEDGRIFTLASLALSLSLPLVPYTKADDDFSFGLKGALLRTISESRCDITCSGLHVLASPTLAQDVRIFLHAIESHIAYHNSLNESSKSKTNVSDSKSYNNELDLRFFSYVFPPIITISLFNLNLDLISSAPSSRPSLLSLSQSRFTMTLRKTLIPSSKLFCLSNKKYDTSVSQFHTEINLEDVNITIRDETRQTFANSLPTTVYRVLETNSASIHATFIIEPSLLNQYPVRISLFCGPCSVTLSPPIVKWIQTLQITLRDFKPVTSDININVSTPGTEEEEDEEEDDEDTIHSNKENRIPKQSDITSIFIIPLCFSASVDHLLCDMYSDDMKLLLQCDISSLSCRVTKQIQSPDLNTNSAWQQEFHSWKNNKISAEKIPLFYSDPPPNPIGNNVRNFIIESGPVNIAIGGWIPGNFVPGQGRLLWIDKMNVNTKFIYGSSGPAHLPHKLWSTDQNYYRFISWNAFLIFDNFGLDLCSQLSTILYNFRQDLLLQILSPQDFRIFEQGDSRLSQNGDGSFMPFFDHKPSGTGSKAKYDIDLHPLSQPPPSDWSFTLEVNNSAHIYSTIGLDNGDTQVLEIYCDSATVNRSKSYNTEPTVSYRPLKLQDLWRDAQLKNVSSSHYYYHHDLLFNFTTINTAIRFLQFNSKNFIQLPVTNLEKEKAEDVFLYTKKLSRKRNMNRVFAPLTGKHESEVYETIELDNPIVRWTIPSFILFWLLKRNYTAQKWALLALFRNSTLKFEEQDETEEDECDDYEHFDPLVKKTHFFICRKNLVLRAKFSRNAIISLDVDGDVFCRPTWNSWKLASGVMKWNNKLLASWDKSKIWIRERIEDTPKVWLFARHLTFYLANDLFFGDVLDDILVQWRGYKKWRKEVLRRGQLWEPLGFDFEELYLRVLFFELKVQNSTLEISHILKRFLSLDYKDLKNEYDRRKKQKLGDSNVDYENIKWDVKNIKYDKVNGKADIDGVNLSTGVGTELDLSMQFLKDSFYNEDGFDDPSTNSTIFSFDSAYESRLKEIIEEEKEKDIRQTQINEKCIKKYVPFFDYLLHLVFNDFTLSLTSYPDSKSSIYTVLVNKLKELDSYKNPPYLEGFSEIWCRKANISSKNTIAYLRDYPTPLFFSRKLEVSGPVYGVQFTCPPKLIIRQEVDNIAFHPFGPYIIEREYTEPFRIFHSLTMNVDSMFASYGMCTDQGIMELCNSMGRLATSLLPKHGGPLPFWDALRIRIQGPLKISISNLSVHMLSSFSPYMDDYFGIYSGPFDIDFSSAGKIALSMKPLLCSISTLDFSSPVVIWIPFISISASLNWICKSSNPYNHYPHHSPSVDPETSDILEYFRADSLHIKARISIKKQSRISYSRSVSRAVYGNNDKPVALVTSSTSLIYSLLESKGIKDLPSNPMFSFEWRSLRWLNQFMNSWSYPNHQLIVIPKRLMTDGSGIDKTPQFHIKLFSQLYDKVNLDFSMRYAQINLRYYSSITYNSDLNEEEIALLSTLDPLDVQIRIRLLAFNSELWQTFSQETSLTEWSLNDTKLDCSQVRSNVLITSDNNNTTLPPPIFSSAIDDQNQNYSFFFSISLLTYQQPFHVTPKEKEYKDVHTRIVSISNANRPSTPKSTRSITLSNAPPFQMYLRRPSLTPQTTLPITLLNSPTYSKNTNTSTLTTPSQIIKKRSSNRIVDSILESPRTRPIRTTSDQELLSKLRPQNSDHEKIQKNDKKEKSISNTKNLNSISEPVDPLIQRLNSNHDENCATSSPPWTRFFSLKKHRRVSGMHNKPDSSNEVDQEDNNKIKGDSESEDKSVKLILQDLKLLYTDPIKSIVNRFIALSKIYPLTEKVKGKQFSQDSQEKNTNILTTTQTQSPENQNTILQNYSETPETSQPLTSTNTQNTMFQLLKEVDQSGTWVASAEEDTSTEGRRRRDPGFLSHNDQNIHPPDEEYERSNVIDLVRPQFTLQSDETKSRMVVIATRARAQLGRFPLFSFPYSPLELEIIEKFHIKDQESIEEKEREELPKIYYKNEVYTGLEGTQAFVAPTDVDVGENITWVADKFFVQGDNSPIIDVEKDSDSDEELGVSEPSHIPGLLQPIIEPCQLFFTYTYDSPLLLSNKLEKSLVREIYKLRDSKYNSIGKRFYDVLEPKSTDTISHEYTSEFETKKRSETDSENIEPTFSQIDQQVMVVSMTSALKLNLPNVRIVANSTQFKCVIDLVTHLLLIDNDESQEDENKYPPPPSNHSHLMESITNASKECIDQGKGPFVRTVEYYLGRATLSLVQNDRVFVESRLDCFHGCHQFKKNDSCLAEFSLRNLRLRSRHESGWHQMLIPLKSRWEKRDVKRDVILHVRAENYVFPKNYPFLHYVTYWNHFEFRMFPVSIVFHHDHYNLLRNYFIPSELERDTTPPITPSSSNNITKPTLVNYFAYLRIGTIEFRLTYTGGYIDAEDMMVKLKPYVRRGRVLTWDKFLKKLEEHFFRETFSQAPTFIQQKMKGPLADSDSDMKSKLLGFFRKQVQKREHHDDDEEQVVVAGGSDDHNDIATVVNEKNKEME